MPDRENTESTALTADASDTTTVAEHRTVGSEGDKSTEPKRPCDRTLNLQHATLTPDDVNKLASNAGLTCREIQACESLEDAKTLAEAVEDNWRRFYASC